MTIQSFCMSALLLLTALISGSVSVQTLADQPKEQREAVRKILDLGGDWELGAKTVLIGFIAEFVILQFAQGKPCRD